MQHVFISYSRRDSAFADELLAEFQRAGIDAWIDRRNLPVSVPWLEDVQYAISGALVVVACRSPEFDRSTACGQEIAVATELGVPVSDAFVTEPVAQAVKRTRAVLEQAPKAGILRAEITRRAVDWKRAGRSHRALASGKLLRDVRHASRRGDLRLSPDVSAFLRSSARRDRRRRVIGGLGAATIGLCFGITWLLNEASERLERDLVRTAEVMTESRGTALLLEHDPYRGILEAAKTASRSPDDAFAPRDRLMRALAVPVPIRSRAVSRSRARGFTGRCPSRGRCRSATVRGYVATSSSLDGVVTLRDAGGRIVRRISAGAAPGALAISPDRRVLAVGRDADVGLYSLVSGTRLSSLRGGKGSVTGLAWSADARDVTALMDGSRTMTWRWRGARTVLDRPGTWFLALSPVANDGSVLAVARDGTIHAANVRHPGPPADAVKTNAKGLVGAVFPPRGDAIVLLGDRVSVVNRTSGAVIRARDVGCGVVSGRATASGREIWVTCANGPVKLLDLATLAERATADAGQLGALRILPGERELLTAGSSFSIMSSAPGRPARTLLAKPCGRPWGIDADAARSTLVVVGDGAGRVGCTYVGHRRDDGDWHFDGHLLPRRPGQQGRVARLSPDGSVAAVGYSDGTVATFTLPAQTPGWLHAGLGGAVRAIEYTPDGKELVVATREGLIEALPACAHCDDARALAQVALDRLAAAREMGLTTVGR